ncbi:TNF receptor-associated factor 4-like [Clytia hemisphaerica]|uniref:TRAF-type domain-containing protein n=1 Tax=Clytia hemisphaerica TaxID=252671 RepID=A0A7M5VBT7_9CNID
MELRHFESHLNKCLYQIIPCEQNCGKSFIRAHLTDHLEKDCPIELFCQHHVIGCQFKGTNSMLKDHMTRSTNAHFILQMKFEMRLEISQVKKRIPREIGRER